MEAESMGEFKKSEWLKGSQALGCNDISSWKAILGRLRSELQNKSTFKEMYKFVFGFACEKGFKSMEVEVAIGMWTLLIGTQKCKFLDKWQKFLEGKHEKKELTVVSKDTWDLFYDLVTQTNGDFDKFEDDGCWPVLIDEFNAFMNP